MLLIPYILRSVPHDTVRVDRQPLYKSLYVQVLAGIVAGVLLGVLRPETGAAMRPLGDGFIKLVRMLIAPIIFATIVVGIARHGGAEGGRPDRPARVSLFRGRLDRSRSSSGWSSSTSSARAPGCT